MAASVGPILGARGVTYLKWADSVLDELQQMSPALMRYASDGALPDYMVDSAMEPLPCCGPQHGRGEHANEFLPTGKLWHHE